MTIQIPKFTRIRHMQSVTITCNRFQQLQPARIVHAYCNQLTSAVVRLNYCIYLQSVSAVASNFNELKSSMILASNCNCKQLQLHATARNCKQLQVTATETTIDFFENEMINFDKKNEFFFLNIY